MTTTLENEIDFLTYCQLTANVYPEGKDKYNSLSVYDSDWKRMDIYDNIGEQYENNLYDFDKIQKQNDPSIK